MSLKLGKLFIVIQIICIIILLTLLILPKESIENFASVEISIRN